MPNTSAAESLLALIAGPTRAAAIYGGLTEIATIRRPRPDQRFRFKLK